MGPTMAAHSDQHPSDAAVGFLTGLLGGVAGGLLTIILPVVGVGLLAVGVVAALINAMASAASRPRQLSTAAGFLIGSGALFLYGSWNTISACAGTDDFCGNANVVPLLAATIALLVVGFLLAAGAVASARGTRSR